MKGVVVLLALVAVAACQAEEESVFDQMRQSYVMAKLGFDFAVDNNVLDATTASGYTEDVANILAYAEGQLCFDTVGPCDSTNSMILGCNCVNAFKGLGDCAAVPCNLMSIAKSAAPVLRQMVDVDTVEGLARIVMDNFYIPITNILCSCPGTFGAAATCVADYDGQAFMMMENGTEMEAVYRQIVGMLDLDTITEVVETIFTASCGEIDGVNCYQRAADSIVEMVAYMANSVNENHDPTACNSMKKHERVFEDYINAFDYEQYDSNDLKKYVNRLMTAYVNMERAVICDEDCAGYLAENFYGCCAKHAMDTFSSDRMQRKVMKVLKNVYKIVSAGEKMPNISKAVNKYYSIYDFEKFCPDITLYKDINDMCDAVIA